MTVAIRPAMSPYSRAVAPESSRVKRERVAYMVVVRLRWLGWSVPEGRSVRNCAAARAGYSPQARFGTIRSEGLGWRGTR